LIAQTLYSGHHDMIFTPEFPLVAKVGHAHAGPSQCRFSFFSRLAQFAGVETGYGKMRFRDDQDFGDFRGLIALHGDYVTAEPFVEWDWDGRTFAIS
jgi:hypothetical protein